MFDVIFTGGGWVEAAKTVYRICGRRKYERRKNHAVTSAAFG
jgi:hypothetical protein